MIRPKTKILFIDTGEKTASDFAKLLAQNGMSIEIASNDTEGVQLVEHGQYDFIITDPKAFLDKHLSDPPNQVTDLLEVGDLVIDLVQQRAQRGSQRLDLTPKEFSLLSLLARHPGEVLSRDFISNEIWETNLDEHTNFVDVHIRRLRSKVDDPFSSKLIRTIRGSGYVLQFK